jgi:hypothetical protein
MGWGIRLSIITAAFITGTIVGNFVSPAVLATGEAFSAADLSSAQGSSLVVTCIQGTPTIAEVRGSEGAVQVKCDKSAMRVLRSTPVAPRPQHLFSPWSAPIAAAIATGK